MSAVLHPSPGQNGKRPASPILPSPAAANAAAASFAALTARLDYLDHGEIEQVRKAYRFADEAHLGQIRASGEPYITHPIAVAAQCAEWKLDAQALMAALLHDAIEDCLQQIPNRFQLVLAATYRARMLSQGHAPKIESKNKPGVTALREIAAGEVGLEMLRKVPI